MIDLGKVMIDMGEMHDKGTEIRLILLKATEETLEE